MKKWIIAVLLLTMLLFSAAYSESLAPDFTVYDPEGNAVSLSNFAGTPVIVNVWASWCGPCRRELPFFEEAAKAHEDIAFLMIDVWEEAEEGFAFAEEEGYTFPVYADTDRSCEAAYGFTAIPCTILVMPDGTFAGYCSGSLNAAILDEGISIVLGQ